MKKATQLKIFYGFFLVFMLLTSGQQLRTFAVVETHLISSVTEENSTNSEEVSQEITQNNTRKSIEYFICFLIGGVTGIAGMFIYQKSNEKSPVKPSNDDFPSQTKPPNFDIEENHEQNISSQPTQLNLQTREPSTRIFHRIQPPDIPTPPARTNLNTQHNFNSSEQQIIKNYNQNRKQVCKNATEVSETVDSINQRRLGVNQSVILEKVGRNKGNYCIIPDQGFSYLLPKDNLRINEYNYETVTILFDCYNYQPGRSSDFQLKTPAVVVTENHDTWRLQQKGELQFI